MLEDIAGWSEEGGPHTGAYSELPKDAACLPSESVVPSRGVWMEPFPPNGRRASYHIRGYISQLLLSPQMRTG